MDARTYVATDVRADGRAWFNPCAFFESYKQECKCVAAALWLYALTWALDSVRACPRAYGILWVCLLSGAESAAAVLRESVAPVLRSSVSPQYLPTSPPQLAFRGSRPAPCGNGFGIAASFRKDPGFRVASSFVMVVRADDLKSKSILHLGQCGRAGRWFGRWGSRC
jgi:hypothetical protein